MAITLATVRDQVETHLTDSTNLIFSTAQLDEAIRSALAEISNSYGSVQTLDGLDGETDTSIDERDLVALVIGSTAHALRFRMYRNYEEANPEEDDPIALAKFTEEFRKLFQGLLTHIGLRRFQESTDVPYSAWDWDEEDTFV